MSVLFRKMYKYLARLVKTNELTVEQYEEICSALNKVEKLLKSMEIQNAITKKISANK